MNLATLASPITLAQAAGQPAPQQPPTFLEMMTSWQGLLMALVLVFYIFIFSNKRKETRAKKEKMAGMKRGDRVQTIGGILGKVVEVEERKVLLKVDESSNTKIWFSRDAIHAVLGEEKVADAAAATPAKS
ncbi:MAG TPA: preprotein translocase subunit YajC [Humisphaera sp.]